MTVKFISHVKLDVCVCVCAIAYSIAAKWMWEIATKRIFNIKSFEENEKKKTTTKQQLTHTSVLRWLGGCQGIDHDQRTIASAIFVGMHCGGQGEGLMLHVSISNWHTFTRPMSNGLQIRTDSPGEPKMGEFVCSIVSLSWQPTECVNLTISYAFDFCLHKSFFSRSSNANQNNEFYRIAEISFRCS